MMIPRRIFKSAAHLSQAAKSPHVCTQLRIIDRPSLRQLAWECTGKDLLPTEKLVEKAMDSTKYFLKLAAGSDTGFYMESRRDFLKRTSLMVGASGVLLSESIRRAFAIDPAPGTTFMDAEHVVILMQENRSFDHLYGTLRGVRGFDDPRAIQLPNGNPVWFQSNKKGDTFAPFRLDIKNTNVTWLGSLPHSWTDQTDARNQGKHDSWLDTKKSGHKECEGMPFTMGAYTREDVPFYYDLADAFTICDQHFCSSLTGTMPNRLYLWSGTIRGVGDASVRARVNNGDVEYENSCCWKTFPDRLEELGVPWKVYQNEISSVGVGFSTEEAAWLENYGDNPLEWFPQFNVGFSKAHLAHLGHLIATLPAEIAKLSKEIEANPTASKLKRNLASMETALRRAIERKAKFTPENFEKLSEMEKNLHAKGLSTNSSDPDYHELTDLRYQDGATERVLKIPKGDILRQFRQDVSNNKLPTVSWIVAPENFSDHPSSAWYGAWYVSEVMNILTQNPEVWRKTIFLLTYDENDGYFDHMAPFVAPHPQKPETGTTSGIKTEEDFVTMEEELKTKQPKHARESPIGLGYRVPMVIASPWSRGGYVCSEVFDHTSSLQFLETLLSKKLGKPVKEPNISDWRRTVCGNLTSSFRPYMGEKISLPAFLKKEPSVANIHKAKFKPVPTGFKTLTVAEIQKVKEKSEARTLMIHQEPGTRFSCALPYELAANGAMNPDIKSFEITLAAGVNKFGEKAAGAAFNVYAPGNHRSFTKGNDFERCRAWNFAVKAGAVLKHSWNMDDFEGGIVFLRVYGPNGFFREFRSHGNPVIGVQCEYQGEYGVVLAVRNSSLSEVSVEIIDNSYGTEKRAETISAQSIRRLVLDTRANSGWHDLTLRIAGNSSMEARFAGRIETGSASISDPVIGRV